MAVLNSYGRAVEMFAAGALRADRMVSHAFCLDDYAVAIEQFRAGRVENSRSAPRLTRSVELL